MKQNKVTRANKFERNPTGLNWNNLGNKINNVELEYTPKLKIIDEPMLI
jgi:hypothetical protein